MFRSAGKPIDFIPTPEEIARFLGKVIVLDLPGTKSHGCWKWTGGITEKNPYGQFSLRCGKVQAHRLSFQMFVGPLLPGEDVHHAVCRNPWCVNPRHLEAMTRPENVADGNSHRVLIPICFMGGPLDGEEKHFYPGRFPETYEIKSYGKREWYRFDEDLREYVYEGFKRIAKRH